MGIADFPVEILHLLKIKPASQSASGGSTGHSTGSNTSLKDTPVISEDRTASASSSRVSLVTQDSEADKNDNDAELRSPLQKQTRALSPASTSDHRSLLGKSLRRPSSRSRSPRRSSTDTGSQHPERHDSASEAAHISLDAAVGASKGVGRIVGVGLRSPLDFTLGLARGFHNAPKLYGDESVRQAEKVTDFQSGLKAASKVRFYKTAAYTTS